MDQFHLEIKELTRQQNDVRVLNNFSLQVKRGEFHAVITDNEASLSSLLKILSGEYPYGSYIGDIILDGEIKSFHSIHDSEKAGIRIIYQKPRFVDQMDICENLFLGNEIAHFGVIDREKCFRETTRVLKELDIDIHPAVKIQTLKSSERQKIEIAQCILKNMDVWVLEDLVSALTEKEIESQLTLLNKLKSRDVVMIYLGHRMKDILKAADRITLMSDGKNLFTEDAKNFQDEEANMASLIMNELARNGSVDIFCETYEISRREKDVMMKLIEGFSYKELCETLYISINTIKTHVSSIYQKTGVNNRMELTNAIMKFKRR